MGGGGAVGQDMSVRQTQVPRLTAVLRALTTEQAAPFDPDQAYVARQQALQQRSRQQQQQPGSNGGLLPPATALGQDSLAQQIIGQWSKAPKAAREDFEHYLQAVAKLNGGEMSSEELKEVGGLIWDVLRDMPVLDQINPHHNLQTQQLKPYAQALKPLLQHMDSTALAGVVLQAGKLRRWQQQLGVATMPHSTQMLATVRSGGADASRQHHKSQPAEFGAGLEFNRILPSDIFGAFLGTAVPSYPSSQMSQHGGDSTALGTFPPGGSAVGLPDLADSDGVYSTPGEIRDMFAANVVAAGPGIHPPARRGVEDVDADLDIDSDDEKRGKGKKVGLLWLERWCRGVGGDEQVGTLGQAVCTLLVSEHDSNDVMAAELLELLGDNAFEAVGELMDKRRALKEAVHNAISTLRKDRAGDDEDAAAAMPSYGTGVTIKSESQKMMAKLERKDRRRGQGGKDSDIEFLSSVGFEALVDTERGPRDAFAGLEFVTLEAGGGGAMTRGALPKGTARKTFKGYEEVTVPPQQSLPPPTSEELVAITDLEDWAQLAFPGYKSLNRIQSKIFPAAYYSNENLLVCAPTGAGKTNIAMIAVLREIAANRSPHGIIQKGDFKVVYVAPMKALAAEVTANFSKRLAPLGLVVKELTGDMQLSKRELTETQMIVTTPEKWDVVTRKGGDVSIASLVKLLIIDEVHLLNDDRGPVIETLIARTLRQVEASQSMIRIVGLSATLPNYQDVATFLGVNPSTGLYHFDASYRPVPLAMQFVGVTVQNMSARNSLMNEICYNKVVDSLKQGNQCMVFVHSRKDTGKTARILADLAAKHGELHLFTAEDHPQRGLYMKDVRKSRNRELVELFDNGFGIHHAGMLRSDRSMTERLFGEGLLQVLCCTATLAWGVNLPAHTVVIKGTQVYDAKKGNFSELSMLDVQQIFGRAGRPQFDTSGEGIIITTHAKLAHYLGMLTAQVPIESQFRAMLVDNLNAEIVLGTVTNLKEAMQWLTYTYMYVRMLKNPLVYGLTYQDLAMDPSLEQHKRGLILEAAKQLKDSQMAVFDEKSGTFYVTELGRVASHFYIRQLSMVTFNEMLRPHMSESDVLAMMSRSHEFESMMVREEELPELDTLLRECPHDVKGGAENKHGKANILIQAFISRAKVDSFSLIADMMYVSSNAPRIARALFEICLRRKWSSAAEMLLDICKALELRIWPHQHPLRQFEGTVLHPELLFKMEERGLTMDRLVDMDAKEIGAFLRHPAAGDKIASCLASFPTLLLEAQLHPITRTVLRIALSITPDFEWKDRVHGSALRWWVWVEDSANEHLYHAEPWVLTKKMAREGTQKLAFTIPIFEPLPPQYYVRLVSDSWLQAEAMLEINFQGLILPQRMPPHTELLDLDPLPVSALNNPLYESMYAPRFTHFNPIQTQAFHTLYHTDENVLLGAPTGSGKTISSELTMLRVFNSYPDNKIIYIAPLKALVRERISDWGKGLCATLGKKLVELTGDYTPDLRALLAADIIICTPEKWDGISRNWQTRGYVKKVGLLIIDEIHLLGADRGPILEVIVSRMRYIAAQMDRSVRFVGLSTALANAQDLADWLGIGPAGLFNFKPSVRPVPLECHIQGYPGKFYCPRMASMNKPAYAAIQVHAPLKPVLIFVSSRRQTRLTALDIITYAAADERPHQFVHMDSEELQAALCEVQDASLRHTLQFGIGLHHAGLNDGDRTLVERLFVAQKIQVLVATSTLAWGVNTPAHLVIIKGTEYYDAPSHRYVDFPITDVLQMMGRAGRPQYDKHGVAVIMVHEPKKQFYKRFLYEPFPVESSLQEQLADHLNAEVVSGTISCRQDALDYLTWTYLYRRIMQNPSYYDVGDASSESINAWLCDLVEATLTHLQEAGCIECDDGDDDSGDGAGSITPTAMGRVASYFYLKHTTMAVIEQGFRGRHLNHNQILEVLCGASEYDDLPVRHNEDRINLALSREMRWRVDTRTPEDPHLKANLLLQAHMSRLPPPISDYLTDTKSVLDNSVRLIQALVDVAADAGTLGTAVATMELVQALMQGRWMDDNSLMMLPHMNADVMLQLDQQHGITALPQLLDVLRFDEASSQQQQRQGGQQQRQQPLQQQQPKQQQQQQQQRHGREPNLTSSRTAVVATLSKALGPAAMRELLNVCERLPICAVTWSKPRAVEAVNGVHADDENVQGENVQPRGGKVVLDVDVTRLGGQGGGAAAGSSRRSSAPRVYAPRFPKLKEEGWWLVIGHTPTRELLALRRVSFGGHTTVHLTFPQHSSTGHALDVVTLYLVSDAYIGLDQQYDIRLDGQIE